MLILRLLLYCFSVYAIQDLESSRKDVRKVFRDYEKVFSRKYKGREELERYKLFKKRFIDVKKHNKDNHIDYYMEINKFSDMRNEELGHYLGMGNFTEYLNELEYTLEEDALSDFTKRETEPLEVDHTAEGIVTPIKNQHACGSCWAFSAVGAFESAYTQTTGYLKSFSEQEILDCYYGDTYDSCNGGYHYKPFYYIKHYKRLATYNDYPYVAKDGDCQRTTLPSNGMKNVNFTGFKLVQSDSASVQRALAKHVLAVALHASTMFYYRSGVFTGCPATPGEIDHAMVMTGYAPLYWTLKNSWGTDWGDNGYIRVSRGPSQSTCKITQAPVYPEMEYLDMGEKDNNDTHAEKDEDDVALTGIASQSTTYDAFGKAKNAIDGDINGNFSHGSCSKTKNSYTSWWNVEFEKERTVQRIVIHLRSDNEASLSDMDGATLHVGNRGDHQDPQCSDPVDTSTHDGYRVTKVCANLKGRFVTVDLYDPRPLLRALTLCEVQVYSHDEDEECKAGTVKCDDGLCKPPSFC